MTGWEVRLGVRVLDAMAPRMAEIPPPSALGAGTFLVKFVAAQPAPLGLGLRALILLYAACPVFVLRTPRWVWNLTADQQVRYFSGWENSRFYLFRMASLSLKTLLALHWVGHPEVRERVKSGSLGPQEGA
jgi:hypothetical protein